MSREKGARAELEVAALLEQWWRFHNSLVVFKRTPLSGGWSGAPEFGVNGDLVCNDPNFPFAVEVKRRENWNQRRMVEGKASPVWGWWKQACRAASAMQQEPMLWIRQQRCEWIVVVGAAYMLRATREEACWFWLPDGPAVPLLEVRPACVYADKFLRTFPGCWIAACSKA
jgi:hypothetical protein